MNINNNNIPEFVPYNTMTQEEQDNQQKIWEKILKKHCPPDEFGCQPCDNGLVCDKCHYDPRIQSEYAHELAKTEKRLPESLRKYFHNTDTI